MALMVRGTKKKGPLPTWYQSDTGLHHRMFLVRSESRETRVDESEPLLLLQRGVFFFHICSSTSHIKRCNRKLMTSINSDRCLKCRATSCLLKHPPPQGSGLIHKILISVWGINFYLVLKKPKKKKETMASTFFPLPHFSSTPLPLCSAGAYLPCRHPTGV